MKVFADIRSLIGRLTTWVREAGVAVLGDGRVVVELIRYSEKQPRPAGGRFLRPFTTELGFFLMRMLGATGVLLGELATKPIALSRMCWGAVVYAGFHIAALTAKRLLLKRDGLLPAKRLARLFWLVDSLQLVFDVVFASLVVGSTPRTDPVGKLLFLPPILHASYRGPHWRQWASLSAFTLAMASGAMLWPVVSGAEFPKPAAPAMRFAHLLAAALPSGILAVLCVAIRLFRNSQLRERDRAEVEAREAQNRRDEADQRRADAENAQVEARRHQLEAEQAREIAEKRRLETEAANRKIAAMSARERDLNSGTECGITMLRLDGGIEDWNKKQRSFAPKIDEADLKKGPCYWVFHHREKPCKWCELKWKLDQDEGGEIRRWPSGAEHHVINIKELEKSLVAGRNWTISNQLEAGEDESQGLPLFPENGPKPDRLHLFYIYFGPVRDSQGAITHVVESVTEITEAVLEMPFLLRHQHDRTKVPEGLPPISVVSVNQYEDANLADPENDRRVLEMNSAKFHRCQKALAKFGRKVAQKEELFGEVCFHAYGRQQNNFCSDCPVQHAANEGRPVKRVTDFPGPALVTAVPLFGPDGEVRAVFEFIDDITELITADDSGRELNALESESDVVERAIRDFKVLAVADHCLFVETAQETSGAIIHQGNGLTRLIKSPDNSLLTNVLAISEPELFPKADGESDWERILRLVLPETEAKSLGHGLAVPLLKPDSQPLGIMLLLRGPKQKLFGDEVVSCRLLAGHFAAAFLRARERQQLITAMERTGDVLNVNQAAAELLQSLISLFPKDYALLIFVKAQVRDSKHRGYRFAAGAGDRFEQVRQKLEVARAVTLPKELEKFATQTPVAPYQIPPHADHWGSFLALEGTNSMCIFPFIYGDHVLGFLAAQSSRNSLDEAFPGRMKQWLELVAEFGNIIVSRSQLLRDCVASYGHGFARLLPPYPNPRARDVMDATRKMWRVAIGDLDVLHLEELNLKEIVDNAVDTYNSCEITDRSCRAENQVSGLLPLCLGDRSCICVCVAELLENACNYRDPDTEVIVSAKQDGGLLRLDVTNQGHLPFDWGKHMFEPFTRGREHLEIPGTGLGLWQVGTLIRAHPGGKIEARPVRDSESSEKNFVTFSLWIPAAVKK